MNLNSSQHQLEAMKSECSPERWYKITVVLITSPQCWAGPFVCCEFKAKMKTSCYTVITVWRLYYASLRQYNEWENSGSTPFPQHASFVAERDLELMQWSGCMDESTQEEMSPDHLNGLQHVFVQPDATARRAAKSWPFFQGGHSLSRSNVLKSGVQLIACIWAP